jgi:hypothetical protein
MQTQLQTHTQAFKNRKYMKLYLFSHFNHVLAMTSQNKSGRKLSFRPPALQLQFTFAGATTEADTYCGSVTF